MAPTILCLASYFKGGLFLEECKRQGCHTILITTQDLEHEAWPRHAIDEFFMLPYPNLARQPDITNAVSYLAREREIDRIIALDDYDVETVAELREHLRMPGMGGSTARYFRDKLAMRVQAREKGVPVPDFVHVLNYERLRTFMARVPGPWVLKPRSEASSMGIKKVNHADELWSLLNDLGDRQSYYVLEKFIPGDVFHVDSVVWNNRVVFAIGEQVWSAAHDRLSRRRRLCHRHDTLPRPRRSGAAGAQSRADCSHGHGARCDARRVHPRRGWPVLFPGDRGARGRRRHRPTGGIRHRPESVGRVGAGRDGPSARRRVSPAAARNRSMPV